MPSEQEMNNQNQNQVDSAKNQDYFRVIDPIFVSNRLFACRRKEK